jgi:hypothetical protein
VELKKPKGTVHIAVLVELKKSKGTVQHILNQVMQKYWCFLFFFAEK